MNVLKGKGVVDGVAMGKVLRLDEDFNTPMTTYESLTTEEELKKVESARLEAEEQIKELIDRAKASGEDTQAEVLEAHVMMVNDIALIDAIQTALDQGLNAVDAVKKATDDMSEMLAAIDDPYLQERSADVKDIGKRLLRILLKMPEINITTGYQILVGEDIDPSLVANMTKEHVGALILGQGSTTSHAVIIAKTKGIATIVGLGSQYETLENDMLIIADGANGDIVISPDQEAITQFEDKQKKAKALEKIYDSIKDEMGMTKNGTHIPLAINVGNPSDIDQMAQYGAEGVGLFRTEFVFMGKHTAPTEDEQFEAYKYVVTHTGGALCVIRTMDIGGDKPAEYLGIGKEENPFLGWRALRISLDTPELFKTQIRAILRASHYGKTAIMLPMVISLTEIKQAKKLIHDVMTALKSENIPFDERIEIGIMIETPAAVLMAEQFAKEVDFFSVGTNDLTQYTLAVDRGNARISDRYDAFNPAVLKAIAIVAKAAKTAGIWIGMCGEMAGDPMALPLLISMGFDELSMSAPSVPKAKYIIKSMEPNEKLLDDVLALDDVADIRKLLTRHLQEIKLKEEIHEKDY